VSTEKAELVDYFLSKIGFDSDSAKRTLEAGTDGKTRKPRGQKFLERTHEISLFDLIILI